MSIKYIKGMCDALLPIDGTEQTRRRINASVNAQLDPVSDPKEKVESGYDEQKELLDKLYIANIAKIVSNIKDRVRGSNLSKENTDQLIVDVVSKVEHYVYEIYEFFVNDN